MQAILLVTVFSCLLGTAAGAGAVGEACLADSTCTDPTSVCESKICKAKAEATCADTADCVSHSTCSSTKCACDTGYTALTSGLCTSGAAGEACKADGSCADKLVCESSVCKIKAGEACPSGSTNCVSHSACPASGTLKCTCDGIYTALTSGLCTSGAVGEACKADGSCADKLVCESSVCKIKAGETCTSGSTDCVSHSTCPASGTLKCTCDGSYTETSTGLCNGVAPQSVSSWLLTGSIITFLVTLSLP